MTNDAADDALRARFAALRSHDDAFVPAFEATLARAAARAAPAQPRLRWQQAWVGGGLAAALLGLWLAQGPRTTRDEPIPAVQLAWQSPTDGLMADAHDPSPVPSWNGLPTTNLGRSSFSHYQEFP
jgi:hypothetical protein